MVRGQFLETMYQSLDAQVSQDRECALQKKGSGCPPVSEESVELTY